MAIWTRKNAKLEAVEEVNNWQSTLLGIRFVLDDNTLFLYRPDGERFATYTEILDLLNTAKTELVETKTELVEAKQQL